MTASTLHSATRSSIFASIGSRLIAYTFAVFLATGVIGVAQRVEAQQKAAKPAAPTGPTVSKKVRPPLQAATEAYNAKNLELTIAKLQEAEAADGKTPYDQFKIEELRALVFLSQNKYAEALAIYEQHKSNPEYIEPQFLEVRPKLMAMLAFRAQAHPKAIEYGKEWLATHPDDTDVIDQVMRSNYIGKNYKEALENAKAAISVYESAGKTPQEVWLQLVPSCANNLNDIPGVLAGYEKLVRYYGKPEHWAKALDAVMKTEKNDAAILYVVRLMADTDTLTQADHYMEYAQRATDKALPGEAARVLETGFEKKVLGASEKDKASQQRALTTAQEKAKQDKASLPESEKEVRNSKSTTGQLQAGLGLAYYSFQMYPQAVEMLQAGIAKGGLKNPEDYQMVLGISLLKAGQKEQARQQFEKLVSNASFGRIARFWAVRTYN